MTRTKKNPEIDYVSVNFNGERPQYPISMQVVGHFPSYLSIQEAKDLRKALSKVIKIATSPKIPDQVKSNES